MSGDSTIPVWEADFLDARRVILKHPVTGRVFGQVRPCGGSFEVCVWIDGSLHTMAVRPDQETGKQALLDFIGRINAK